MPEQPFINFVPCSICAERPGTLHMVVQTESGRQGAVMCESCARDLMEGFGQAGFGPTGAGAPAFGPNAPPPARPPRQAQPQRNQSDTPALDEFGRDLTGDA